MAQQPDLRAAQEYLDTRGWVDLEVYSYGSRSDLAIAMAPDLSYYHEASLVFGDPSYFSGPLHWTSSTSAGRSLRLVPPAEREARSDPDVVRAEGHLFEFLTDDDTVVLIAAAGVTFTSGTVYYYRRENLKPGESVADWVVRGTPSTEADGG